MKKGGGALIRGGAINASKYGICNFGFQMISLCDYTFLNALKITFEQYFFVLISINEIEMESFNRKVSETKLFSICSRKIAHFLCFD